MEEAAKVNATRANVYAFLSRAFKAEVDDGFLNEITAIQPTIELLSETQDDEELKEGNRLLIEFIQNAKRAEGQDRKTLITNLAVEYANLFLGIGSNPVHIVESVYLGKHHVFHEEPYHEIIDAYRVLGFEKQKDFFEPEDHLSVEFEFIASLCTWASKSLQTGDVEKGITYLNLQNEFLRDHLIKWVPEVCRRLKSSASSSLYRATAHLTGGFVALDSGIPEYLTGILKSSA